MDKQSKYKTSLNIVTQSDVNKILFQQMNRRRLYIGIGIYFVTALIIIEKSGNFDLLIT